MDGVIPKRVALAARWLERNYTFQYMKEWKTFNVVTTASFPYIITLSDLLVKRINVVRKRVTAADGTIEYGLPLKQLEPGDRSTRPIAAEPESYWLNGVSSLVLNTHPSENMTFEANLTLFTRWGSATSWTHWLLDNATELLLARTLMMLSVRRRDPKLYATYQSEFDLEIKSFNVAEEDLQSGDVQEIWTPLFDQEPTLLG